MSAQGWNLNLSDAHSLGNEHSMPFGSNATLLACRVCDKIFQSTYSLIEHYETHEDELARRQDHPRGNYFPSERESRERNFTNNSFQHRILPSSMTFQQRHHPYFPNGYRALQPQVRARNPLANVNPFLVSTLTPSPSQQRHPLPVAINNSLAVPPSNTFSFTERHSLVNTKQSPVHQSTNISLPPQVSTSIRRDSASVPQPKPTQKTPEKKGMDESAENGTVWYLGQLEQPMPKIIDLSETRRSNIISNMMAWLHRNSSLASATAKIGHDSCKPPASS